MVQGTDAGNLPHLGVQLMLLTGCLTTNLPTTPLELVKGAQFEIDHVLHMALEPLVVSFTGLILQTAPPQMEIDTIVGAYELVEGE